jgi:hypothetical protein
MTEPERRDEKGERKAARTWPSLKAELGLTPPVKDTGLKRTSKSWRVAAIAIFLGFIALIFVLQMAVWR